MIAVDTNVLVRLFVCDDVAQAARAEALFDAHTEDDGSLFISDVVLAEFAWTLARAYRYERRDIAQALQALLDNVTVRLESPAVLRVALDSFRHGPADFPDCFIVAKALAAGCEVTVTFDRRMQQLDSVRLL